MANKTILIKVRDKIATRENDVVYICGNSGFSVVFDLDEEWSEYDVKTARFRYGGEKIDVVFHGSVCPVPVISDVLYFSVGLFAGNLETSTPAIVAARKSILCGTGYPDPPTEDVYNQILDELNRIDENMEASVAEALESAKESGEFDGPKGDKGDPFTYEDFTPEQLAELTGPQGEAFTYDDFTAEQLEALRGPAGDPGKDAKLPDVLPYSMMPEGYPRANDTEELLPETTMEFSGDFDEVGTNINPMSILEGSTYRLTIDGVTFEAVAQWNGTEAVVTLGTESDPMMAKSGLVLALKAPAGTHTVKIDKVVERTVEPMAEEFLPTIPFEKMPEGYPTKADGKVVRKLDNEFLNLEWLPTTKGEQLAAAKIVTNLTGTPTETTGGFPDLTTSDVSEGMALVVVWDGVDYPVTVKQGSFLYAGNYGFFGGEDTGEPFLLRFADGLTSTFYMDGVPHVAAVYAVAENPIPAVFLDAHNADPAAHPALREEIKEELRGEMLQMLSDLGLAKFASSDGSVLYTDNDGKIYVL